MRPLQIINTILLIVAISLMIAAIEIMRDGNRVGRQTYENTDELVSDTMTGRIGQPVGQEYMLNKIQATATTGK